MEKYKDLEKQIDRLWNTIYLLQERIDKLELEKRKEQRMVK
jgi:hypothetical protein